MDNNNLALRSAHHTDAKAIWEILQHAIASRKADGSNQWQDGYPNPETVATDLDKGWGMVVEKDGEIIGYAAVIFELEPAYENIEGKWLSEQPYLVVHRVAVAPAHKGKGFSREIFRLIEALAVSRNIYSVKVDTNFDNTPMLRTFDSLGYTYCGEVYFRGSPRRAYEKLLSSNQVD